SDRISDVWQEKILIKPMGDRFNGFLNKEYLYIS
ncbi:hypothetical protein LCGC14_2777810, partial [marine sediment metagenome]